MFRRLIIGFQIVALSFLGLSCIKSDPDDCGLYLEFTYDYNMEFVDAFDPQIESVDVFVFDASGTYQFTKQARREELLGGKRMLLGLDLPLGAYQVLTVGGLCDEFQLSDELQQELIPGVTTLDQVRLSLLREPGEVSAEFPHIWMGPAMTVENRSERTVWKVNLTKNTNRFNLALTEVERKAADPIPDLPYSFEIVTPEGAAYSCENEPLSDETVVYTPYQFGPGTDPEHLWTGHLKTCRLFDRTDYDYRLIVRDTKNGKPVWDYNLMVLLENTKPANPIDGSVLPLQEYLDRQSEWNIVVLHRGGYGEEAFVAIGVRINGWILWLHDIEL